MDLNGWRYKRRRILRNAKWWVRDHEPVLRVAAYCAGIVVVLITVIQVAYPSSRLLPLVRVGGERVGSNSREVVGRQVDDLYAGATVTVKTATKQFVQPLQNIGVTVDAGSTAKLAASYPVWQRIIPFSSVLIALHRNTAPVVLLDESKLHDFANQVAKDGAVPAVDASIVAKNGKAILVPARPSQDYPVSQTVAILQTTHYKPRTTVRLAAQTKDANRSDAEVRAHLTTAQKAIDTPLTLNFASQTARPDKKTISSWLTFKEVAPTYNLTIEFKQDAVDTYLQAVEQQIYKAPGTTKVHTIDDREVDRTTGTDGYGIILDKAYAAISTAVQKGDKAEVNLDVGKLDPSIEYNRQYSNTDQKVTSLIRSAESSHPGYAIAYMKIDGASANTNGNKQFETASTYKLFVAYAVLKAIDSGRMRWSDAIVGGRDAEQCFEDMIVVSDNDCPVAFKTKLGGWQAIESEMHSLGLSSKTSLTGPTLLSTANDISYFLYRLQNGTLLNPADASRLLGLMKRQIYRSGIPAGTGLVVADKVGFVDDVIHDAGIVYPKSGPYVLVVMTSNGSWAGIADVADQINDGL